MQTRPTLKPAPKPANRAPVNLPDTSRQWISNDQAPKPTVTLRGPVRLEPEIIDIHGDCDNAGAFDIWVRTRLPGLAARLIAAIATGSVLFYLYSELARIVS